MFYWSSSENVDTLAWGYDLKFGHFLAGIRKFNTRTNLNSNKSAGDYFMVCIKYHNWFVVVTCCIRRTESDTKKTGNILFYIFVGIFFKSNISLWL